MTWEIPYADENESPEFTGSYLEDGEPLSMDADHDFNANAIDGDSDAPVIFSWSAGGRILFDQPFQFGDGADGQIVWASQIVVPYDSELDGEQLTCTIFDDEGATARRAWPLVML